MLLSVYLSEVDLNCKLIRRATVLISLMGLSVAVFAGPGNEAHGPSQGIADAIRQFAGSEIAFVPAGILKESGSAANLATYLMYPADGISLVKLKGSQVRHALERSLALYPSSNSGFLQLSGLEVTFSKSAPVDARVISVLVGNQKLDDSKTYTVAMPATLAHGGMGYFRVWDKTAVTKEFAGSSLESVVDNKTLRESNPRWIASPN